MNVTLRIAAINLSENGFLPEHAVAVGLVHRVLECLGLGVVFTTDVDVSRIQPAGVHADRDPLNEQVRIKIDQHPVFKSTGLGFVAIHCEVTPITVFGGQKTPLHASGEPGTTAPPQLGEFDDLDHLFRLHRQGFAQRIVPAGLEVMIERDQLAVFRVAPRWRGDPLTQDGLV